MVDDILALDLQLVTQRRQLIGVLLTRLLKDSLLVLNVMRALRTVILKLVLQPLLRLQGALQIRGHVLHALLVLLHLPLQILDLHIH